MSDKKKGLDQGTRIRYLQCLIQIGLAIDTGAEHLQILTDEWVSGTLCNHLSSLAINTPSLLQLDVLRRILVYAGGPTGPPLSRSRSPVLDAKRRQIIAAVAECLKLEAPLSNGFGGLDTVIVLLRKSKACKDEDISYDLIWQRHNDLTCSLGLDPERLQFCEAVSESDIYVLLIRGGAFRGDTETGSRKDSYLPAKWLNKMGIHAYILSRYTCAQDKARPLLYDPFHDVENAVKIIRDKHPGSRVGLWGFSAGGLMASVLSPHADFIILVYAITSMEADIAHSESRLNLLGQQPSGQQIAAFSAASRVSEDTCPAYIFHSKKDQSVVLEHSLRLTRAYINASRPFQMVVVPDGPHGAHGVDDLEGLDGFLEDIMKRCAFRLTHKIDLDGMNFTGQTKVVTVQNYEASE